MNYNRFLNVTSLARQPSAIRKMTEILSKAPPSMISLSTGMPNSSMFPFKSAEISLRDGGKISLDEKLMSTALQYGPTPGYGPLVKWLKEFQAQTHKPPTLDRAAQAGGMDLLITSGCQDAICKTVEMLVEPGDNVLTDSPCYPGFLAAINPHRPKLIPLETDHDGMKPETLRKYLSKWSPKEAQDPNSDIPKFLYTIPTGCNPTGAVMTFERKKEVYQLAQEYDLLILEDDPYFFLQFIEEKHPSFLSIDTDGRVLRFDSFSKILSSGLRVGFVTGPQPLVHRLVLHQMASCMHSSSLGQVMISELFEKWGQDGFHKHVDSVANFYKSQRDAILNAADKYLSGLCEWNEPQAGMFLWLKVKGVKSSNFIMDKAFKKNVLLVPGNFFQIDDSLPSPFIRASFSMVAPDKIDEGVSRLAEMIEEELQS